MRIPEELKEFKFFVVIEVTSELEFRSLETKLYEQKLINNKQFVKVLNNGFMGIIPIHEFFRDAISKLLDAENVIYTFVSLT